MVFEMSTRMGSALPRGATVIRDRTDSLAITPQGVAKDAPLIFYIHGGGFTIGSPRTHAALAGHLAAKAGMRAYLPRYRLAPEHAFPAARDDVIARYEALCAAGNPPVALCGDSAGGCPRPATGAIHPRPGGDPRPQRWGLSHPLAIFPTTPPNALPPPRTRC